MAILKSDKVDSIAKKITRDKDVNYIIIIGWTYWEDITILNVHAPNKSMKLYETKTDKPEMRNRQIQSYVRDFNSQLSVINRTMWRKVSNNLEELNHPINQQKLIDIYRTFTQQRRTCTFFKCPWNSHQGRPYTIQVNFMTIGHKTIWTNFKELKS